MKSASDKQISFAKTISWYTKIPLPLEETASAYWKYIQENIYSKMNSKLKVHFIKDLEYEDLKKLNVSNIVLDNTLLISFLLSYDF